MTNIESMKKTLAENLTYYLDKKMVNQTDMARHLGFPETTVSNWMKGETYPRPNRLQAMADYFSIKRSDLTEVRPVEKDGENPWIIKERLLQSELQGRLDSLNEKYAGMLFKHVNSGDCYRISNFSVLNHDGVGEFAVNYHPFDENAKHDFEQIKHTRPALEFFDGRFVNQAI